ncbi:hypothetical protein QKT49_gp457 [Acanthamoeba castellanii medusavirus]|uniref:Uncharacterized protein n=1 Tax=Acanthamoeba castellanii medusavirus J1 TaxID=3114988 RepID=A0A3T1CWV3_9VIRU|nr:hypothetical protein QKT49_gp457 [Acanthamoeba castellanii medusavirus]BBI30306.1 hypothetical protein [Acanthamoeba castellanii medusavirus J1]
MNNAKPLPWLSTTEVHRRLAKVVPFCTFEGGDCWVIKSLPPGKAYMWEKTKTNEFMGVLCEGAGICGPPDAEGKRTKVMDVYSYPTLHTYGWYGFFKPDILEVVQQLPDALFDDYDKLYVTTEPASTDINRLMAPCGQYHMGKTTVAVRK